MELKNYQKQVMGNLSSYLGCLAQCNHMTSAWREYWFRQDVNVGFGGVPAYQDTITGVPHICMKVPTGGGKTFMGCSSLKTIFRAMPADRPKLVVWLVPSDSILSQTIRTLSDTSHPYRQRIDMDFNGRVGVYTKEQLLNGQNFTPDTVQELLTICVFSYASLRINSRNKDARKVFQENGNLLRFAEYFHNRDLLLADTPDTALIQVIRQLAPVVIVDESHNATSDLSIEMLENLNPHFILDLTATPRNSSNIISYVDARELKRENMVKLPVVVYNRERRNDVILDALRMRAILEQEAREAETDGAPYIRPIILFQAQPNIRGAENETFDRIKQTLLGLGIPEEQIAIKTSGVDTLGTADLMSRECPIRYIITVNALKEGWDCPFAYILASLANRTSEVEVEQIVGRILRQPYARSHSRKLLNSSYVFTCSRDFHRTLDNIVAGLNRAGFSKKDYRVGEECEESTVMSSTPGFHEQTTIPPQITTPGDEAIVSPETENSADPDLFTDISIDEMRSNMESQNQPETQDSIDRMVQQAETLTDAYTKETEASTGTGFVGGELGEMLTQNVIQPQYRDNVEGLLIPQFFCQSEPDLFSNDRAVLLEAEHLSEGFNLSEQDAQVSFELATGDIYRIDLQEQGDAVPKYRRAQRTEAEYYQQLLAREPEDQKLRTSIWNICQIIESGSIGNRIYGSHLRDYVTRIVNGLTGDELQAMETALPFYAGKIRDKIISLEEKWREKQFFSWLDSGKIFCQPSYTLPQVITPANTMDSVPLSLYTAEKDDMNQFERRILDIIAACPSVLWWHRIMDRVPTAFRLNAYLNHYPDFLVRMKSGKILLVETKGEHLDGTDSMAKLKIGRAWQHQCGGQYRYFMVFEERDVPAEGAYTKDQFAEVLKNL